MEVAGALALQEVLVACRGDVEGLDDLHVVVLGEGGQPLGVLEQLLLALLQVTVTDQ